MKDFGGTKGPWEACCTSEGKKSHYVFAGSGYATVCAMNSNDPDDETGNYESMCETVTVRERQANAKLIQSAPDMLEALTDLLNTYDEKGQLLDFNVDKARKAVKRALGEE